MLKRVKNIIVLKKLDISEPEVWQAMFWDVINIIAFLIGIFFLSYAPQKILNETESIKKAVLDLWEEASYDSDVS